MSIVIFDQANFAGRSKTLPIGQHKLSTFTDFPNPVSSIRVPEGLVAMLYEHVNDQGGFGRFVDLLEDRPSLADLGFHGTATFISVFAAAQSGLVWARNSMSNGQFVPGHWERKKANPPPPNRVPVVSPTTEPTSPSKTIIEVRGPQSIITALASQDANEERYWSHAQLDQMDVIGNDFRWREEIGSAAFERGSNSRFIPDNLNFWYPQKEPRDPNDHRAAFYKRTLAGKVREVEVANIPGIFQDFDVCIDITPNEKYTNLLTNAHPREYSDLMGAQWTLSLHTSGQPDCDDAKSIEEFTYLEAEIRPASDPHSATPQILNDRVLARSGHDICVYGPWIYDKGHCCHPEIHPAEQIWWRDDISKTERRYFLSVFCDASKRFWWRDQMDDGTKLKPWAAPPIAGLFAIAFEVELGKGPMRFEVTNIDHFNVAVFPSGNQTYSLVHQNSTLVTFTPHNDSFKVSFENIGLVSGNRVRGFLVIETSVGTVTQKTSKLVVPGPFGNVAVEIPPGTDVNKIDQRFERQVFEKVEGHYMFTLSQFFPALTLDPNPA